MTAADHRANIDAIRREIDRIDNGFEDERERLERELEGITERWKNDRLELVSQWGDEQRALGEDCA